MLYNFMKDHLQDMINYHNTLRNLAYENNEPNKASYHIFKCNTFNDALNELETIQEKLNKNEEINYAKNI